MSDLPPSPLPLVSLPTPPAPEPAPEPAAAPAAPETPAAAPEAAQPSLADVLAALQSLAGSVATQAQTQAQINDRLAGQIAAGSATPVAAPAEPAIDPEPGDYVIYTWNDPHGVHEKSGRVLEVLSDDSVILEWLNLTGPFPVSMLSMRPPTPTAPATT
jgi:hypothetical protein